jgi:hypothetical protein
MAASAVRKGTLMSAKFIATATIAIAAALTGVAANAKEAPQPTANDIQPTTRICVVQPAITGSILPTKVCKTAADWQKDGVDPVKLVAGKN